MASKGKMHFRSVTTREIVPEDSDEDARAREARRLKYQARPGNSVTSTIFRLLGNAAETPLRPHTSVKLGGETTCFISHDVLVVIDVGAIYNFLDTCYAANDRGDVCPVQSII
jgi:hypothetical protein